MQSLKNILYHTYTIFIKLAKPIWKQIDKFVNWKKVFLCGSYIGLLSVTILTAYFYYLSRSLPLLSTVAQPKYELPSNVYDIHGTFVEQFSVKKRVLVKYNDVPPVMIDALLSIEDSRFFDHFGIDPIRIFKAVIVDLIHMSFVQGASTLTQQTAKMFFLSSEKKIVRKMKEVLLALKMENELTKKQILELYLNKTYFGNNAYGIEAAAQTYFHKHAKDITLPEAALLAGLPQAPSRWAPTNSMENAKRRRNTVLKTMYNNDKITEEQYEKARATPIILAHTSTSKKETAYFIEYVRRKLIKRYGMDTLYKGGLRIYTTMDLPKQIEASRALTSGLVTYDRRHGYRKLDQNIWRQTAEQTGIPFYSSNTAQYKKKWNSLSEEDKAKIQKTYVTIENKILQPNQFLLQNVVTGIIENIKKNELTLALGEYKAKIYLHTSKWASKAESYQRLRDFHTTFQRGDVVKAQLIDFDNETGTFLAILEQKPKVNGSMFVMNPHTGDVLAIVGGYEFKDSEFNRAIQSYRQTGSAFKPFVYAYAFDNNYTRMTLLDNTPIVFHETNWRPQNYGKKFSGPMFLKDALAYSKNLPTIHLAMRLKINNLISYVHQFGVTSHFPHDLTLSLGSASISLAEMVHAYSVFDNAGAQYPLRYILKITDSQGKVLWKAPELASKQIIDPSTSFLITRTLEDAVQHGTGRRARNLYRPSAGKTGTTNNFTDAWFIGYTPNLVAGVYVGFDSQIHTLGRNEEGSVAALPIWVNFMQSAIKTMPILAFTQPSNIKVVRVDKKTGLLPCDTGKKTVLEYFKEGTEPTDCASFDANTDDLDNSEDAL